MEVDGTVLGVRLGCAVLVVALVVTCGLGAGAVWVGFRMLEEPEVSVALGTSEDGIRSQQKIYEIAGAVGGRTRGRPRQIVLSEPEVNAFLARHMGDTAKFPFRSAAVRLVGEGLFEFKGQLPLRQILTVPTLLPGRWLERPVWLHLGARASLEVAAARGHHRYLRLDIERLAIGRQPIPAVLVGFVLNPAILSQLRWRVPDAVEAITIETRTVAIRTAS
jgi:hypothetical protein